MFKNRKMVFQIGIVLVLVFVFVTIISGIYVSNRSTKIYLNAKNEMINKDLDRTEDDLKGFVREYLVDYWVSHTDEIDLTLNSEEILEIGDDDILNNPDRVASKEDFEKLSEKSQVIYAKLQKTYVQSILASACQSNGYENLYCIVPQKDGKGFIIADDIFFDIYDNDYSASTISDATSIIKDDQPKDGFYDFGDIIDFKVEDIDGLKEAIDEKADKTVFEKEVRGSEATYVGYQPFYDSNGKCLFIVVAEYDWSSVYSALMDKDLRSFIINMTIGLVITAGLILICLYFVAVRPLKKVGAAVDTYMESKNSGDVEDSLEHLNSRNEIGVLANNIKDMTKEIDKYTADNIALATEKAKVKTELDMANAIQTQSLIKEFPKSEVFDVFASMKPAKEVGGDFFDVFDVDENRVAFVIADVSGKGMPAALMMMASMTSIRNYTMSGDNPADILKNVNEQMVSRDVADMFVTAWIGILDKKTGILYEGNAGHEYPALKTEGRFELIKERHSPVLGAMPGIKFREKETQLKKGDAIFVYTDGVPEATNSDVKMFGVERMIEALNKKPDASPARLLDTVKSAVDEFVGDAEQFDDLTMLCIRYLG